MCEPQLETALGWQRGGRGGRSLTQALSSIKLNFALTEARCKLTGSSSSCKERQGLARTAPARFA